MMLNDDVGSEDAGEAGTKPAAGAVLASIHKRIRAAHPKHAAGLRLSLTL
jgi:hypothetical protein